MSDSIQRLGEDAEYRRAVYDLSGGVVQYSAAVRAGIGRQATITNGEGLLSNQRYVVLLGAYELENLYWTPLPWGESPWDGLLVPAGWEGRPVPGDTVLLSGLEVVLRHCMKRTDPFGGDVWICQADF